MNIRDIPFKPVATAEHVAQAKQWLLDNKKDFRYTANFGVFSEGKTGNLSHKSYLNQPCHASISGDSQVNRVLVATECGFLRRYGDTCTVDTIIPFVKWLLNESYFGRFILNGDDPEWCANNGFVISADVYTPLLQNICIVTRHFYESSVKQFKKFAEMVSKGCPGNLAFVLCFNLNWGATTTEKHIAHYVGSGHRSAPSFRLQTLENFLNWETKKPDKTLSDSRYHYRVNNNYNGGSSLFNGGTNDEKIAMVQSGGYKIFIDDLLEHNVFGFRDAVRVHRQKGQKESVYKAPNPFAPRDPSAPRTIAPNQMTFKELFEFFVPWFVENYYNIDGTLKERIKA